MMSVMHQLFIMHPHAHPTEMLTVSHSCTCTTASRTRTAYTTWFDPDMNQIRKRRKMKFIPPKKIFLLRVESLPKFLDNFRAVSNSSCRVMIYCRSSSITSFIPPHGLFFLSTVNNLRKRFDVCHQVHSVP